MAVHGCACRTTFLDCSDFLKAVVVLLRAVQFAGMPYGSCCARSSWAYGLVMFHDKHVNCSARLLPQHVCMEVMPPYVLPKCRPLYHSSSCMWILLCHRLVSSDTQHIMLAHDACTVCTQHISDVSCIVYAAPCIQLKEDGAMDPWDSAVTHAML